MCIYSAGESECIFIELINTKKSNVFIGAIYRHPNMDLDEFIDIYLNPFLDKTSKESKLIFLLSNFNADLLKYDHHASTNEFLDSISSYMFLLHIIQPTRLTSNSKALVDNIFSNILGLDSVSGNLTATVSDHLPQFPIASNVFSNSPSGNKSNIYERDETNFD